MKRTCVAWLAVSFVVAAGCSSSQDDTPCGSSSDRKCGDGEGCTVDGDCAVGSCIAGACNSIAVACTTDAQQAQAGMKLCDGEKCSQADECASQACTDGTCAASANKTCGVGRPNPCQDGEICQQAADCVSDYCNKMCGAPPADVHSDGIRNAGETGTDCGGSVRADKPCPGGQKCVVDDDCEGLCKGGVCDAPSATDGKKNQGETDVDCGGPNAPGCKLGKACGTNDDCNLKACTGNVCVKPTSDDGIVNGGETDVDCGGAGVSEDDFSYTAPRCKEGQVCTAGGDCMTGACSPGGKCALPSCATAETAGITTCGAKETNDPTNTHDSCCKSLQLPTRTTRRLDKYEITAGRMRTFLTKVGPNVRAWVSNFIAANPSSQLAQMIGFNATVENLFPAAQMGPLGLTAHMAIDIDNYGGIRGCFNGPGNYSANTYWQDATALAEYPPIARSLPRTQSDEKPLNCAMPMMLIAFCAWDGGELATLADVYDAWDGAKPTTWAYPWGPTDIGRPNYNWCNGTPGTGGFNCQNTNLMTNGVQGVFYEYPPGQNPANDLEIWIAAPGRFVNDATALKSNGESWYDLFANLGEYTGDLTATNTNGLNDFCDFSGAPLPGAQTCTRNLKPGQTGTHYTNIPAVGLFGDTWEGHQYNRGKASQFPVTFQYGKFGGRCARAAQ